MDPFFLFCVCVFIKKVISNVPSANFLTSYWQIKFDQVTNAFWNFIYLFKLYIKKTKTKNNEK